MKNFLEKFRKFIFQERQIRVVKQLGSLSKYDFNENRYDEFCKNYHVRKLSFMFFRKIQMKLANFELLRLYHSKF